MGSDVYVKYNFDLEWQSRETERAAHKGLGEQQENPYKCSRQTNVSKRERRGRYKKESQNISGTKEIISISNSGRQAGNEQAEYVGGIKQTKKKMSSQHWVRLLNLNSRSPDFLALQAYDFTLQYNTQMLYSCWRIKQLNLKCACALAVKQTEIENKIVFFVAQETCTVWQNCAW